MMRPTRIAACLGIVVALSGTAAAQTTTVQSLLSQEFAVVGVIRNPAVGVGLFLQKKDQMFMCFVSETPTSTTVATRYCKPVQ